MPLSKLKAYFISLICESIFAGIYTFLFCVSLYLLLRHGKPRKTNIVILVLTVVMYCLSVVHLAICFQINLAALFEQKAALLENTDRGNLNTSFSIFACAPIAAETLNCIIGDSIVIWRTWVLWNRNHRITYFPCTLLLGGTVAGILMVRAMYISLARETPFNSNATFAVIAFCALTTTINLYAILAIGYRVWTHSRAMKVAGSKGIGDMGGFYTRIILIFVESGFVYCAFPTLMLILFRTSSNGSSS
ncbi:hypothetical protein D9757_010620 [Collybiopsis confluens]|uniref:Uncharacterized protein n=1 Tax=Collybiopsis confluens TaxID=2823264 RepID=A0A8H5LUP3_9AGAR|nr:hypothetical protein D9757_010620 [Collybiopsis confluens]